MHKSGDRLRAKIKGVLIKSVEEIFEEVDVYVLRLQDHGISYVSPYGIKTYNSLLGVWRDVKPFVYWTGRNMKAGVSNAFYSLFIPTLA